MTASQHPKEAVNSVSIQLMAYEETGTCSDWEGGEGGETVKSDSIKCRFRVTVQNDEMERRIEGRCRLTVVQIAITPKSTTIPEKYVPKAKISVDTFVCAPAHMRGAAASSVQSLCSSSDTDELHVMCMTWQ